MAKRRYKLEQLEIARNENLDELIPKLCNKGGQKLAADVLGVSQFTISTWLKSKGYVAKTQYLKVGQDDSA